MPERVSFGRAASFLVETAPEGVSLDCSMRSTAYMARDWGLCSRRPAASTSSSVAARSRGAARSETQIGNDIPNLEPLRWLLKSQFDRNVVVNFEIQELIFDHVFTHLGIGTEVSVLRLNHTLKVIHRTWYHYFIITLREKKETGKKKK